MLFKFRDYEESLIRARDVVKKSAFGVEFVIFEKESQQRIHYAMPLRVLLYDGMGYLKDYREIVHSHKKKKDRMTMDEFLSGMRREDRLHPIVSAIVYYGEQAWDGPLCLKDMIVEMPGEIERVFCCAAESGQYTGNNGKGYARDIKCFGHCDCQSGKYMRWRIVGKTRGGQQEC